MRSTRTAAVAGAAAIGLVGLAGAPAHAGWTSVDQTVGARAYACKIVHGSTATIRLRVDARHVDMWIKGGVGVTNAAVTKMLRGITVKAKAGTLSKTKSIVVAKKLSSEGRLYAMIASPGSGSVDPLTLTGMKKC